jgi:hypothetical protein
MGELLPFRQDEDNQRADDALETHRRGVKKQVIGVRSQEFPDGLL